MGWQVKTSARLLPVCGGPVSALGSEIFPMISSRWGKLPSQRSTLTRCCVGKLIFHRQGQLAARLDYVASWADVCIHSAELVCRPLKFWGKTDDLYCGIA